MMIIHSNQTHIETLPADLRESMVAENSAISSNSAGMVEIIFTDDRWSDLLSEFGADQYFDETDQGQPWMQYYAQESE